jgi:hypothetical protein
MTQEPDPGKATEKSQSESDVSWPSRVLLKIRNQLEAHREKAKSTEYRKERRERWTVFGLFVAAAFALLQWSALRSTDEAIHGQLGQMEAEFAYLHRPHFRLRFASIDHSGDKMFSAGMPVVGSIDILNNGQTAAKILGSHLEVYWAGDGLPTTFPNKPKGAEQNEFVCSSPDHHVATCRIEAGEGRRGSFYSRGVLPPDKITADIEAGNGGWKIYLIGWISYQGTNDQYTRHFDFAEVYDPKRRRFFPVTDDPDYNYDPDAK